MTKSGSLYDAQYSETFSDKKNNPKFRSLVKRIEEKCSLIREAPYTACRSERLRWNLRGKRSGQLDDRFRLIYIVCEECINQDDKLWNDSDCPDCEGIALKRVRFIDITDYH